MSDPDSDSDPAAQPASDSDPGPTRVKRRSRSAKRVRTKVRAPDGTEAKKKLRKKVMVYLKWAGLWVLACLLIWVGLKMFVKPPPMVVNP